MSTDFITGTYNPDVLSCIANLSSDGAVKKTA